MAIAVALAPLPGVGTVQAVLPHNWVLIYSLQCVLSAVVSMNKIQSYIIKSALL